MQRYAVLFLLCPGTLLLCHWSFLILDGLVFTNAFVLPVVLVPSSYSSSPLCKSGFAGAGTGTGTTKSSGSRYDFHYFITSKVLSSCPSRSPSLPLSALIERIDTGFATDDDNNDSNNRHNVHKPQFNSSIQRVYYNYGARHGVPVSSTPVSAPVTVPVPVPLNLNHIIYATTASHENSQSDTNDDSYDNDNNNYDRCDDENNDNINVDDHEKEENMKRRITTMLQNMKDPSSYSPTGTSRLSKSVSESQKKRQERETSVGKRRIGSASKARTGSSNVGRLMGNVRTSAAAAAALKKRQQMGSSTGSPPPPSPSKDRADGLEKRLDTNGSFSSSLHYNLQRQHHQLENRLDTNGSFSSSLHSNLQRQHHQLDDRLDTNGSLSSSLHSNLHRQHHQLDDRLDTTGSLSSSLHSDSQRQHHQLDDRLDTNGSLSSSLHSNLQRQHHQQENRLDTNGSLSSSLHPKLHGQHEQLVQQQQQQAPLYHQNQYNNPWSTMLPLSPGIILIPQRYQVYQKSLIPRSQLRDYLSIQIAQPSEDVDIAKLRLSVFGDNSFFASSSKDLLVRQSCQMIAKRRQLGSICLSASVNYVDANSCLIGSLECSTHEFDDTALGLQRPPGSMMYITEVAVSQKVRRSGVGRLLMEALNKLAYARNIEALYLHVETDNIAAISLYRSDGFKIIDIGTRHHFEFTRKLDLYNGRVYYLMRKDIKPRYPNIYPDNIEHHR